MPYPKIPKTPRKQRSLGGSNATAKKAIFLRTPEQRLT